MAPASADPTYDRFRPIADIGASTNVPMMKRFILVALAALPMLKGGNQARLACRSRTPVRAYFLSLNALLR